MYVYVEAMGGGEVGRIIYAGEEGEERRGKALEGEMDWGRWVVNHGYDSRRGPNHRRIMPIML